MSPLGGNWNRAALSCLDGNGWLNDEVIYAFINVVASGTEFTPLDPCFIQTAESYRISSYPLGEGELLFPLHMRNGSHWGLAWLRIAQQTIILYDSMAFLYLYSVERMSLADKSSLERIWRKVTDRPLNAIVVAPEGSVHVQADSFNCGVYVCLYAERLCKGEATVKEDATYAFLQDYRQYIRNRLTGGCTDGGLDVNANVCDVGDRGGESEISRLHVNEVDERTVYAFLKVVTVGSGFIALDPGLLDTDDTYRISGYPNMDGEFLFPLRMHSGSHCSLAWLRIVHKSIVLYDSMGHYYSYSPNLLPQQERLSLEKTWCKVTNKDLSVIIISSEGRVHKQEDINTGGLFVCVYAERLCRGEATVQENVSLAFLRDYCRHVKELITVHDATKERDGNVCVGVGEGELRVDTSVSPCISHEACWNTTGAVDIPECCGHCRHEKEFIIGAEGVGERDGSVLSEGEYNMQLTTVSPSISLKTCCNATEAVDTPVTSHVERNSSRIFQREVIDEYTSHEEPAKKIARGDNMKLEHWHSGTLQHLCVDGSWLSPCLLVRYFRLKYVAFPYIGFVAMGCELCYRTSVTISNLVVLFLNRTNVFGAAVIKKQRDEWRSRGVVIDVSTGQFDNYLRNNLKNVAYVNGFENAQFSKVDHAVDMKWLVLEVQVVGICFFIQECIFDHSKTMQPVPTDREIEIVLDDIRNITKITPSVVTVRRRRRCGTKTLSDSYPKFFIVGEMNKVCRACGALLFQKERSSICCGNGEVCIPLEMFNPARDPLLNWFWEAALKDEHLFYMIRPINNMLACAGVRLNLRTFKGGCGQRPLVLQGRFDIGLCHLNPNSERACFAQLFIADDFKVQRSLEETTKLWSTGVEFPLIRKIMDILKKCNPVVQAYMTMYEIYLEELKTGQFKNLDGAPKVFMNLKQKRDVPPSVTRNIHAGRMNVPVFENQIAAIYVSKDGRMLTHEELDQGLLIKSRGGNTIVPHQSYNIDALTYPLLFPRGEQTFVKEKLPKQMKRRNNSSASVEEHNEAYCNEFIEDGEEAENFEEKEGATTRFVSRREFALYILARRGDVRRHRIIGTGKLYSQYVLHTYARIEADRLCAIGLHRTEVRSSTVSSLFKYLDGKLNEKGVKLGKLVDLPRCFVGSKKWYQKLYSDAMAVAQRLGKPDLFVTFTGSQDWPEIKNNMPGKFDSWITEPFLCCRVFFLRLSELLHDIKKKEIFGKVIALTGSIEFQKRGMPHAHLLITLANKLDTPEKIDAIISAEIPEFPSRDDVHKEEKLLLHNLVKKHMIHGPCSERPDLACRDGDASKCVRGYPKSYRDTTEICTGGYPLYRRRNDGRVVPVGKLGRTFASNVDVVPTNRYLLMKHQCHVNVEVCSAIQAYKYIFKYVFKGPDAVVLELLDDDKLMEKSSYLNEADEKCVNVDMREVYRTARYVSHIEAAYRILGYPLQYSSHTVISLNPHLPNEQPVVFTNVPSGSRVYKSKLMAYFDLVAMDEKARNMTWTDVAENYRFVKGRYVAYKVKRLRIARLWSVNPKMHELYAVRKLLLHKKGVRSFEDLRTHNGIVYNSFMEAAEAAGYIVQSTEWEDCLRCACVTEMPTTIRELFAHILLYCKPCNTMYLWQEFKSEMRTKDGEESIEDLKSLKAIENILIANGMKLSDCGLDAVRDEVVHEVGSVSDMLMREEHEECENVDHENDFNMLNSKQKDIVVRILSLATTKKTSGGRMFFVYGKAGCGKTFTFNVLIHELEKRGLSVIAVASTGIAATLLKNGRTAHSTFSLPLKRLSENAVANVDAASLQGRMLRTVDVIIWDEISMQSRFAVECVDRLLRDVAAPENRDQPFGGVVMIFGGDWCQFLPVIPGASKMDTINETLKASYVWNELEVYLLDENMRLCAGEESHAAWLRAVGEGTNLIANGMEVEIPVEMCMESEDEVIRWMYTDDVFANPKLVGSMALLTVRNADALELNEMVLKMAPGEAVELFGIDSPVSEEEGGVGMPCDDEEFLHDLTPSGMPPYKLVLKPGAIVMLLRNINIIARLCNGTRLEVLSISTENHLLRCRNLLTDAVVCITRMPLDFADERTGIAFHRFQFPVRLSYCMTINKSQGQTFERVGIIMRTPSFAHGSTYVALSRARSKEQVRVTINSRRSIQQALHVRNIVYREMI